MTETTHLTNNIHIVAFVYIFCAIADDRRCRVFIYNFTLAYARRVQMRLLTVTGLGCRAPRLPTRLGKFGFIIQILHTLQRKSSLT